MAGLTDGESLTDVGAGDETETADKGGGTVGEDVTVEVGSDDDVVVLRLTEELVDHGVDDLLLDVDGGVDGLGEGAVGGGAEKAVSLGEDVGLVGDGDEGLGVDAGVAGVADLLATEGDVSSHGGDTERSLLGDALDSLCDLTLGSIIRLLLLNIEILGVLPHNNHINSLAVRADRLHRTNIGVQIELLAQSDDGRRVALDGVSRGGDGAEESAIAVLAEGVDCLVGEGGAGLLEGLETGLQRGEVELKAEGGGEGFEEAAAGGDDFFADAVARDEAWIETVRYVFFCMRGQLGVAYRS